MTIEVLERFAPKFKVDKDCWVWLGATTEGYGMFWVNTRAGLAHRLLYETFFGGIPPDKQLDHLCRNRACVKPSHIEAVSQQENIHRGEGIFAKNSRKTHCKWGHSLENPITNHGNRNCRTCYRIYQNTYRMRKRI